MGIMGRMQIRVYACSSIFDQNIDTKVQNERMSLNLQYLLVYTAEMIGAGAIAVVLQDSQRRRHAF